MISPAPSTLFEICSCYIPVSILSVRDSPTILASIHSPNDFNCQGIKIVEWDVAVWSYIVKTKYPLSLDGLNMVYRAFTTAVKIKAYCPCLGKKCFLYVYNNSQMWVESLIHVFCMDLCKSTRSIFMNLYMV